MFIVKHKKFFITLSVFLMLLSFGFIGVWGLKIGIDFKGGTVLEVAYPEGLRPTISTIKQAVTSLKLGEVIVQPSGKNDVILRMRELQDRDRLRLLTKLSQTIQSPNAGVAATIEQKRFNSIGPVIGRELREKSLSAIVIVIVLIVLFIAFAFRKVSAPVASWKYGLVAVIALVHDVIIPTGLMAWLGKAFGVEVDILFVTALLAILGFSVHDTIVVFDRIRENLHKRTTSDFEQTVGSSLSQTFGRSINTSMTTLIVLLALYFFGGDSTKIFALILSVGIVAGTYSSICLASPLLVYIEKWQARKT